MENDGIVKEGQGRSPADMVNAADIFRWCVLGGVILAMAAMCSCAPKRAEIVSEKDAERALKNLLNGNK